MADSDPKLAPHNVESAGFASGNVKGQYDVSAQARKKAAANTNDKQSPLAAGQKYTKISFKTLQKGLFLCLNT